MSGKTISGDGDGNGASTLQDTLLQLSDAYRDIERDLQASYEARTALEAQRHENTGVKSTLDSLIKTNISKSNEWLNGEVPQVYKLIGPVAIPQTAGQASDSVKARLQFIDGEVKRSDQRIERLTEKLTATKSRISALQSGSATSTVTAAGTAPKSASTV